MRGASTDSACKLESSKMTAVDKPEASERRLDENGTRMSEHSLADLMDWEDSSTGMRCWQGEVEVEDRWGFGSPTTRPECIASHEGFEVLGRSKSRGRGKLHRASRRVVLCFRRSTINLTVPTLAPSTPPRNGSMTAPRTSVSGANNFTFMDDALDQQQTEEDVDNEPEEPTSPVVNCMGQVRPKKCPSRQHSQKVEMARERCDNEKLQRTKSRTPWSPPRVTKSKSCKWKQLLRSTSSSISPSNQPLSEGEPEVDLARFSSASCSSEPFFQQTPDLSHTDAIKVPDKTCLLMQRKFGQSIPTSAHDNENKAMLLQQLDERDPSNLKGEHRKSIAQCEPDLKTLPSLKGMKVESPKWIADEPLWSRRHGVKPSRLDMQAKSGFTPCGLG